MVTQPTTMAQTAQLRARDERGSVCWQMVVPGYTIYGRPRYWRMVCDTIPVGQKAGGFVKSPAVKDALDDLYHNSGLHLDVRNRIQQSLEAEDFLKETVS